MNNERRALSIARWVRRPGAATSEQPQFMFDRGEISTRLANLSVVLERGGVARAGACVTAGAHRVLLTDAVLRDASVMRSALAEFGGARIGAWLPVRRMAVSWALDSQSNGDFKCMVPCNPQARWEVLGSDRQPTGTPAERWIEQLVQMGVAMLLVSVDMHDERDLDLCAGLIERFGDRLWFSPLDATDADVASWVEFGQVRQLVLPDDGGANALAAQLRARFGSPRAMKELVA
jgi:hypothetical protein